MAPSNSPLKFRVLCGDGSCFGPALRLLMTEEIGEVSYLPDTRYLLLKLLEPARYQNDVIEYVLVLARCGGTSLVVAVDATLFSAPIPQSPYDSTTQWLNSFNSAFASCKSLVSNPSVNQL